LVRAELFGAERGAFTGCVQRIVGAVESANGGTLFLDEVGDLPIDVQPMLLRFLERGEYQRLGRYGAALSSDARIVSATNRDLRTATLANEFRSDLWFRLSIEVIEVPSLDERFEDVEAYLRSRQLADGRSVFEALSVGAVDLLRHHRWAGHFRELINFAQRLPASGATIDEKTCRDALARGALGPVATPAAAPAVPMTDGDWPALATRAVAAFVADHGHREPRSWDEVKDFGENYLKPLVFAHLSGADQCDSLEEVDVNAAARRVTADRGTAAKQLQRYYDRFGRQP
jgi:transcriptional regulator with GAF, ATPase, and Fis domain